MRLLPSSALPTLRSAPRLRPKARAHVSLLAGSSRDAAVAQAGGAPGIARLHYRVLDAQGTVLLDDYQTANGAAPATWQTLQVGLRLQQAGAVQLSVETNGTAGPTVYFDDVSVAQTGGLIVQEQHQYAFGAPLPGLSYTVGSTRYRHGYQGQFADKDEETGFDSFELRLYNSRIGRWTAPDPYGQFDSPYVGMGNNPVMGTDPDGGFAGPGPWSLGTSLAKLCDVINTSYLSMGSVMLGDVFVVGSRSVPGIVSLLAGGGLSILSSSRGATMYPTKLRTSHGILSDENYSFVNTFYVAGQVFRPLNNVTNLDGSPAERGAAAKEFYGSIASMFLTGGESVAAAGNNFGEKLFLSEKFGITSTRFGSSAANSQGIFNQGGKIFKAGWSTSQNSIGEWGYKFRIGLGTNSKNANTARFHLYAPKSFVPNRFANPSIEVKRSLFKLGSKP